MNENHIVAVTIRLREGSNLSDFGKSSMLKVHCTARAEKKVEKSRWRNNRSGADHQERFSRVADCFGMLFHGEMPHKIECNIFYPKSGSLHRIAFVRWALAKLCCWQSPAVSQPPSFPCVAPERNGSMRVEFSLAGRWCFLCDRPGSMFCRRSGRSVICVDRGS